MTGHAPPWPVGRRSVAEERAQAPSWRSPWRWPGRLAVALLILSIRSYQMTISLLINSCGPVCRFDPSCSQYMIGALRKYGLLKGLFKGIGRVLRCHPWHPGGEDPP
jgi:uncharacterized protein